MPSHYNDEKKSRFRGLKPGKELTTTTPASEAVSKVLEGVSGIPGAITGGEPVKAYRGYGLGKERGMGFMEAGIPIPEDQAGVMQTMPTRPAVGDIGDPTQTLPVVTGGAPRGAIPAGPVDLTPRLGDIAAGIESALPPEFDTKAAHALAEKRYPEGQAYIPDPRFGPIMDKVLGPAPTGPEGLTQGIPSEITTGGAPASFADILSRATQPSQGGIEAPSSSGNAMVDLFRFVSHNKRVEARNRMVSEQQQRDIGVEQFEKGQEFKERKLASEEKGREGALDLSRRKAIATAAKGAEKLDPFKKRALDLLQKDPEYQFLRGEEKRTAELKAIEEVEKRHGRTGTKKTPKEGTTKEIGDRSFKVVKGQWMEV